MKRFNELTDKELLALTEEQIEQLVHLEMISKNKMIVEKPEVIDLPYKKYFYINGMQGVYFNSYDDALKGLEAILQYAGGILNKDYSSDNTTVFFYETGSDKYNYELHNHWYYEIKENSEIDRSKVSKADLEKISNYEKQKELYEEYLKEYNKEKDLLWNQLQKVYNKYNEYNNQLKVLKNKYLPVLDNDFDKAFKLLLQFYKPSDVNEFKEYLKEGLAS